MERLQVIMDLLFGMVIMFAAGLVNDPALQFSLHFSAWCFLGVALFRSLWYTARKPASKDVVTSEWYCDDCRKTIWEHQRLGPDGVLRQPAHEHGLDFGGYRAAKWWEKLIAQ